MFPIDDELLKEFERMFNEGGTVELIDPPWKKHGDNGGEKKYFNLKCECGAAALGYAEMSQFHSTWCDFYKKD